MPKHAFCHPMPNTIVLLDVKTKGVAAELQLPLSELQLALGFDASKDAQLALKRVTPGLQQYLLQHIRPTTNDGRPWNVIIEKMNLQDAQQTAAGKYQELTVHVYMQPPADASVRSFIFNYDVIVHQVVTHDVLVSVRNDWDAGLHETSPLEVGVIHVDVQSNTIAPLKVNLDEGSKWKGFISMLQLGIKHISEGTDHLLFLLVLLLPAPLLVDRKKWSHFGGTKYSVVRLVRIVTAFTIGHSFTLLLGAIGWVKLPSQPVEILIALSIFISAIHAIRPLFPGKEIYIAAGFGLVHGLAFASVLSNLNLDAARMALSILGFNLGIEIMQLLAIALVIPWLIILSRTSTYVYVRIVGGALAGIAALAWMQERITGLANAVTDFILQGAKYGYIAIFILAIITIITILLQRTKKTNVHY
jgi:hypothetical protein